MQTAVAEDFGGKLRTFQEVMFPAAYGDGSREWTHLLLTKVTPWQCSVWIDRLFVQLRELPWSNRKQAYIEGHLLGASSCKHTVIQMGRLLSIDIVMMAHIAWHGSLSMSSRTMS